ncbi:MAG: hypothetical protein ACREM8_05030 [Vulcanimicrobiaceae bacterium]
MKDVGKPETTPLDDVLRGQVEEENEAANDPGIESDEEIDGEVDAEGGSALKRRSN